MTLIEAMEKAEEGDIVQRQYFIPPISGPFTKWGKVAIFEHGKYLKQGWGISLKLEDLKAEDWEIGEWK